MRATRRWLPLLALVLSACAPQPPLPDRADAPADAFAPRSDIDRAIERHRRLAREHQAAGNPAAAASQWQILTLLAPNDPSFRRELEASRTAAQRGAREKLEAGRAAQRAGQSERAIQAFVQTLALDPGNDEAMRALRELDRQKYARIQQDRAARATPDAMTTGGAAAPRAAAISAGDNYDVEQALEMLSAGDTTGALRDLRAWVDANPRQRAVRQRIGLAVFDKARELETAGAREQALAVYESAIALRGESPPEWSARTSALRKSLADARYDAGVRAAGNDLKLAIAEWEACLRIDPQHARAAARLTEARESLARAPRPGNAKAPK
jgi:tetratricopeptide (TPR) repeat protein